MQASKAWADQTALVHRLGKVATCGLNLEVGHIATTPTTAPAAAPNGATERVHQDLIYKDRVNPEFTSAKYLVCREKARF